MKKYLTYKKFQPLDDTQELVDILKQNNITYQIRDESIHNEDFTILDDNSPKIYIKIKQEDFETVNSILVNHAQKHVDISSVDKDHYLFTFTNEELLEVIMEPDAWNEYDSELAKKLLAQKGVVVTAGIEKTLQEKRLKDLSNHEPASSAWTIFGYISAFLGGVVGIAIGLSLWKSKKTLPNGTRVFSYSNKDREHGLRIFVIGITVSIVFIYLRVKHFLSFF